MNLYLQILSRQLRDYVRITDEQDAHWLGWCFTQGFVLKRILGFTNECMRLAYGTGQARRSLPFRSEKEV